MPPLKEQFFILRSDLWTLVGEKVAESVKQQVWPITTVPIVWRDIEHCRRGIANYLDLFYDY